MILIRRTADTPDEAPDSRSAADIPTQAGSQRPDAVDAAAIARKPRPVATALQNLHGI